MTNSKCFRLSPLLTVSKTPLRCIFSRELDISLDYTSNIQQEANSYQDLAEHRASVPQGSLLKVQCILKDVLNRLLGIAPPTGKHTSISSTFNCISLLNESCASSFKGGNGAYT
jgi:hypothetical protein